MVATDDRLQVLWLLWVWLCGRVFVVVVGVWYLLGLCRLCRSVVGVVRSFGVSGCGD